jgi:hypothetical protein
MPQVPSTDPVELVGKTMDDHGPGWHIWSYGDGHLNFTMGDGTTFTEATSTDPINTSSWQYIVCTYDGSKNQDGVMMYLNGGLDNTGQGTSANFTYSISNNQSLEVGASRGGVHPVKAGTMIGDLRIYNTVLSDSQVSSLYQGLQQRTYPLSAQVTIHNGGKDLSIPNVNSLDIRGYESAAIHGNHVYVAAGTGLYGNVKFGNTVDLSFDKDATITMVSGFQKTSYFDKVSGISIQNYKPVQAYLWQPKISIQGKTLFNQFVGGDFHGNTITTFQDLTAIGKISMSLTMSDTYTLGTGLTGSGPVQQLPAQSKYDEMKSSVLSLSKFNFGRVTPLAGGLLFSPIIIAVVLLIFAKTGNLSLKSGKLDTVGNKT